ncbi:MAG: DUF1214 domain-containing protein [Sphingomonas sp.]|nr:DUF1214 domain-containing protein [Sphingomonas sp.]
MRSWARLLICGTAGIVLGAGAALWSVRAGSLGMRTTIGPWTTGRDFGTAAASAHTRAVVALGGLLALPAHEARYYTAADDDAGRPLDGRCRYRVSGGAIPAKWWSLTLYDNAGYLVPNSAGRYSVGSIGLSPVDAARWTVVVAPEAQPGRWLPTGRAGRFQLTLRAYLPADGGTGDLVPGQLPRIVREDCA